MRPHFPSIYFFGNSRCIERGFGAWEAFKEEPIMYIFPLLEMNCSLRKREEPPWLPDTCRMESLRNQILLVFFLKNLASFLASLFPCWAVSELSQCYLHPAHSLTRGAQRHKRSLLGFCFAPSSICGCATALHSWIVVFSLWQKGARRCQRHCLALIKAGKPG